MAPSLFLFGYPLGHSISPSFQQAALDHLGIDARYEAREVAPDRLREVEAWLRAPSCLGANVTIPHKEAIRSVLDEIDPTAGAIGAVNTIVKVDDRLVGHNTDARGFAASIRDDAGRELNGARILLVGAGGAARAVVAAALLEGAARVDVAARRVEQAEALIRELRSGPLAVRPPGAALAALKLERANARLREAVSRCDLLVNATPVGMVSHQPGELPIGLDGLRPETLVCDLIYRPVRTALLARAEERGAATINGLPMLIYQGAASFELWTGWPAPVALMRRVAEEALRG